MRRDRLMRDLLRERFLVTMETGETFDGLLERVDEATVELVDAFAVTERSRLAVDGRLYLPRARISYMQRPDSR